MHARCTRTGPSTTRDAKKRGMCVPNQPIARMGPMWSTKHHGPTVRRPLVGSTRRIPIRPIEVERPSRTSIVLTPRSDVTAAISSTGPLMPTVVAHRGPSGDSVASGRGSSRCG